MNANGQVTGPTADEDQTATASGVFVQTDTDLSDTLTLSPGARADRVRLDIDDDLLADGDDSGDQDFTESSYSAGPELALPSPPRRLRHGQQRLRNAHLHRARQPLRRRRRLQPGPGTAESAQPGNRCGRGQLGDKLFYELALFRVEVRDEITPYELGGRTFYDNAARTRRDGAPSWMLEHLTTDTLTLTLAYTYSDYQFQRFYDDQQDEDVSGNPACPACPGHHQACGSRLARLRRPVPDRQCAVQQRRVPAENTKRDGSGRLRGGHLRGGKAWRLNSGELTLHAGVNNLFDEEYFSNLRINATTATGPTPPTAATSSPPRRPALLTPAPPTPGDSSRCSQKNRPRGWGGEKGQGKHKP